MIMGVITYVTMTSIVIELVTECNDWSCSVTCFYVSSGLVYFIDSTYSGPVLRLDIISLYLET